MYKLVIIDDEEKILNGIANLFPWNNIGFQVVSIFTDPVEALHYIENNEVDVVMSDIEMPKMSGIELCEAIAKTKNIKMLFFSSYQNYKYFRAAIQNGAVDFLLKPIGYEMLLEAFEKVKIQLDEEYHVVRKVSKNYYENLVSEVIEYLNISYQNATLEEAANRVNLSSSYLSKIFKEKYGESFSEIHLKIRMENACRLLKNPKYKSYEVAYYVGYDNPKNFSRAFKAFYNISPTEYRNLEMENLSDD